MSDENKLIQAFLQLQNTNHPNLFEAAKKAKKDYDKDGKIESEKDEVWGSRLRAAKMAGKLKEATLKDPKDPSVQGSSDVTITHIRPTNPDRIKKLKDPRDSSVQGSGEVTKDNKPVRVKEGVADVARAATTFASDIARAYKGGYGTSARTATGQFSKPGPITGAAQNIARSAGERPAAGAAAVGAVGTAAALGSRKPSTSQPSSTSQTSSTSSAPSKPEAPEKKIVSAPTPPSRPTYMSKAQAFAAARKEAGGAGGKFTYGGKEYQTNIKGEKYSKAPKATSVKEENVDESSFDKSLRMPSRTGLLGKAAGITAAGAALGSAMATRYKEQHGTTAPSNEGTTKSCFDRMKSDSTKIKKEDEEFDLEGFINEALEVGYTIDDVTNYLDENYQLDELSKKKIDKYREKAFEVSKKAASSGDKKTEEKRDKGRYTAFLKVTNRGKVPATEEVTEDKDPCWKDYKMVGMKNKGNKKVPNCVPKEEVEFSEKELAHFESFSPTDSDETTDSSVSTKAPKRTLTDEKKCKK